MESVLHTRQIHRTKLVALRQRLGGILMKAYPKLPKEKKEDNGGRTAHFFVAIAFNKGIVMCKKYHEKLTGERFAKFIKENFLKTFNRTLNPSRRLFYKMVTLTNFSSCQKSYAGR